MSDGSLIFDTGSIGVDHNIFDGTSVGEQNYSNEKDAWVTMNIVQGQVANARYAFGGKCSWKSNGNAQRTALCIGNGQTYQAVQGGINGDRYGNGNGPCMCDTATSCDTDTCNWLHKCGNCKSTNVIEIYYTGKCDLYLPL